MQQQLIQHITQYLITIAAFSNNTLMEPEASLQVMQEMAQGLAEIFRNGVLANQILIFPP